jgi:hypothetical protein
MFPIFSIGNAFICSNAHSFVTARGLPFAWMMFDGVRFVLPSMQCSLNILLFFSVNAYLCEMVSYHVTVYIAKYVLDYISQ